MIYAKFHAFGLSLLISLNHSLLTAQPSSTTNKFPLTVELKNIDNNTPIIIKNTHEFKSDIFNFINQFYHPNIEKNQTNINIQASIKIWNDQEHNIYCKIKETINIPRDSAKSSLEIISIILPSENLSSYLQNSLTKMCRDLLMMNGFIAINILPEVNLSSNKTNPPTGNNSTFDITNIVEFSQLKVAFRPPPPKYPLYAKTQRVQSNIIVMITVNPEGVPVLSNIIQGHPTLNETALSYSLKWRFEPARINGFPQWSKFKLNMPFTLR
jgi:TonB family protein